MVNAVVRAAKDLLHRAFAVDGKEKNQMSIKSASSVTFHVFFLFFPPVDDIPELLSSSSLFSMLLPLILAYIGPVAASVPKVESG